MDLFLISSILLVLVSFLISVSKILYERHLNLPPGKLGWPLIGETLDFAKSATKPSVLQRFFTDRMASYSTQVFKTSIAGEKVAVFCGHLEKKFAYSNENKMVRFWLPRSVVKIMLPGFESTAQETLLRRRRIFVEFLKPDAIQKHIHTMNSIVRHHMDSEWAPNSNLKVVPLVKKLAFSLSSRIFMGIDDTVQIAELKDLFEIVLNGVIAVPVDLPGTVLRRAINASKLMHAKVRELINQVKMSEKMEYSGSFMSQLLTTIDGKGKFLSEMEIASILVGSLIASHDSVSSLMTNLVYFLADHPDVYSLALTEQMAITRNLKDSELTLEDIKNMKYGRNVINEVLRCASSSQVSFREVLHDINYAGYRIPKGWKVLLTSNSTHGDPKCFPNPDKFDPGRFERDTLIPFSFTPFGGGPRMCPGNEYARQVTLIFTHHLLTKFTYQKLIPTETLISNPFTFPEEGLPIKLQRHRNNASTYH